MTKLKWNSAGERLFEAGVDRGVLYTKDVGTPPAPVAVGAPSATKPMLLPLRQWGVEQLLWLPGAAGNYASIPDVNLLDADTAHMEQSIGKWTAGASTTIIRSTEQSFFGNASSKLTATANANVSQQVNGLATRPVVTPGITYTLLAYVRSGVIARTARVEIGWRDAAGTYLGGEFGATIATTTTGWTLISATGVAPANTASAQMVVTFYSALTGETFYVDAVCLRTGSNPTFVPSTRIVGDLDIRAKVALADWTPGTEQAFVTKDNGTGSVRSWEFLVKTDGRLEFLWWDAAGTLFSSISTASVPVGDQLPKWVRVTADVNNGAGGSAFTFYTSDDGTAWTQLGSVVTKAFTTDIRATASRVEYGGVALAVSKALKGAIFSGAFRDGIDGPIVASADFTNPAEVDGDTWTTPEGHTGTINRSGDATAELVDRNVWAFNEANVHEIRIYDRDSLDFGIDDSFTIMGDLFTRSSDLDGRLFGRRAGAGASVSLLFDGVPPVFRAEINDNVYSSPEVSAPKAIWHLAGMVVDRDNDLLFVTVGETVSAGTDISSLGGLEMAVDWSYGNLQAGTISWEIAGLTSRVMIFRRTLNSSDRADLANWDGSVANEPKWLRDDPDLVLYLNADADETVEAYEDDVVVSLHGLKPWYPDFHGIPWNGLVAVNERTVGGEVTPYYIDGIKYLDEASNEDFEATIEAYTYPEEFMQYEGYKEVHNGLFVTHQQKRSFGLSYRTLVGNDLEGQDHAYKIHIIYNAMVAPSDRDNNTISDDIDPQNFSWDVVTKPPDFTGFKQTAHFIIDSREIPTQLLKDIEDILYGTETTDPRLPLVTELIELFETGSVEELYDIWDAGELGDTVDATIDGGEL